MIKKLTRNSTDTLDSSSLTIPDTRHFSNISERWIVSAEAALFGYELGKVGMGKL
jgi:hypothetical protein